MAETGNHRRKRPTQERARESRERIVATAARLFAERGIADTSTNRIAAGANMSIGTLYRYFTDKHEIVEVLRARLLAELEERFTAAVLDGMGLSPRDSVATSLRAIVAVLAEREPLVRALAADATVGGAGFGGLERRLLLLTRAYLLQQLGPLPDHDLDVRAFVMANAGLAAALRIGLKPPPELDRDRLIDETAEMIGGWVSRS
ncbi:TetR/AcrR family transcriptional regulator [Nocardia otitidiscaviarum]|uniref:TetR/AcrR family transcriptional regulator n=1 Tax=Nocardia otitidiscaviarum TaxID=1823 RepID=UPI0005BCA4C3|nr:TetR/AcrR family transcriptional regulator [Nocardia otitidiscaviarum]MBF6133212.1 TetR/AcrR family transcriptional regulator [Nocardia otitidiscaviarum]MBF6486608.1 TetR/AcrR family transcriptional regulator [Nocardia otitidiscaviarum]